MEETVELTYGDQAVRFPLIKGRLSTSDVKDVFRLRTVAVNGVVLTTATDGLSHSIFAANSKLTVTGEPASGTSAGASVAAGAGVSGWSINTQEDRITLLELLFKGHAESAMRRPSLADEDAAFTSTPWQGMAPSDVISYVGKKWGYILRPEVVRGVAETLLAAFNTHITAADLDMKQRGTFASVFVTWMGGGKSTALRKSVFEAMKLLQEEPASFGTLQRHIPALLAVLQLARTAKLAFLYNFGAKDCSEPLFAEHWGLTPQSRLAWCLLYAMLRASQLEGAPDSIGSLLSSVPELLEGKALPSKAFIRFLELNDVVAFIRRVHNILAETPVCIIFAWDEARALPVHELKALTEALFARVSSWPHYTWLFLSLASTVSMYTGKAESVLPMSISTSRHSNLKLIPMRPPAVDSMLSLVEGAWRAAVPERNGGYHLHASIRLWVTLVEGNLRLLECLLSAASESDVWYEVRAQPLDRFLSQGAPTASDARAIVARLMKHIKSNTKLDEEVASFTKGAQDGQWLFALLGHCLLGDVVQAGDSIAGTSLTYALAQSMGVLSIKPPHEPAGAATFGLQDADRQHGMVHMPVIITHILYDAACNRGLFSHEQPLLRNWSTVLPDLLVLPRSKEYHDLGAITLKVELLRLQGLECCMLSKLVPMQGRALDVFGETMVKLPMPEELTLQSARHKLLGEEARIPGHASMIGQGTASEADSYIKFELASGEGDFIIFIQSKYHKQYDAGAEVKGSVAAEARKAFLPDVPAQRQLFVFCTDAAVVREEELGDNVVIVDAQQHPSFYGTAGVAYRQLASTIIQHTERTRIDVAAGHALRHDATRAQTEEYVASLAKLRTDRLAEYAQHHNVSLASQSTGGRVTKRVVAELIYSQLIKRRKPDMD